MLGWTMYFDDIDETIVTFAGTKKGDETWTVLDDAIEYENK